MENVGAVIDRPVDLPNKSTSPIGDNTPNSLRESQNCTAILRRAVTDRPYDINGKYDGLRKINDHLSAQERYRAKRIG